MFYSKVSVCDSSWPLLSILSCPVSSCSLPFLKGSVCRRDHRDHSASIQLLPTNQTRAEMRNAVCLAQSHMRTALPIQSLSCPPHRGAFLAPGWGILLLDSHKNWAMEPLWAAHPPWLNWRVFLIKAWEDLTVFSPSSHFTFISLMHM